MLAQFLLLLTLLLHPAQATHRLDVGHLTVLDPGSTAEPSPAPAFTPPGKECARPLPGRADGGQCTNPQPPSIVDATF